MRSDRNGLGRRLAVVGLAAGVLAAATGTAQAQTGGSAPPGGTEPPPTTTTPAPTTGVATLLPDGSALAPSDAPPAVRKAINAGNRIRLLPYRWGGGHKTKFADTGYDCSGAVSYVLHAAGLLKTPMSSGPLARRWGTPGIGQWITVYANSGHAYAVIAGLRWDTSAVGESLTSGTGPRWRATARTPTGYSSKYYPGF